MIEDWNRSMERLELLLADPTLPVIPPDLMTEAFFAYKNRPERERKQRLADLLRASGRSDLADSRVNLNRAALGPGGPAVSKQIEAVRGLGLDFERIAWVVSAGHFILTDDAFSEAERLAYLQWVAGVFRGRLKLTGMKFGQVPPAVFDCTGLRRLTFNRNPIYHLPDELFALTTLEELDFENCRLKEIPEGIGKLTSLRILRLEGNPIRTLSPAIASCSQLETLHLGSTRLTHLPEEMGALEDLKWLVLVGSKIEAVPEAVLALPKLEVVNVNGTPLARDREAVAHIRARLAERGG